MTNVKSRSSQPSWRFTALRPGLLLLLGSYWLLLPVWAQEASRRPGEFIVLLAPGQQIAALCTDLDKAGHPRLYPERLLSAELRAYLLSCPPAAPGQADLLKALQTHPGVHLAQYNHVVTLRRAPLLTPDDPGLAQQWALHNTGQQGGTAGADIDALAAWDLATGGPTGLGDTVVIAVIDEGFDLAHPDLPFWRNPLEIPGNGLDDDQNGYVDDVSGWNAYANNGSLPNASHGTHVAGIAGARGDNGLGIVGINWDARLLPIAGASGNEALVVQAYGYALALRRRYNATNGAEGAFVVVTNASFGVNFGDPANFPVWCALYDSLGAAGILNVAATMNNPANVDSVGDMPTACPSPWLLTVTNTTPADTRNAGAAFGASRIDLGAPGTAIYSTIPGGNYGFSTGTSQAAPQVTGAVSLLVSAACPALLVRYRNDPAGTALLFRQLILQGVDTLASLQGQVASGGRLNLRRSLERLLDSCAFLPGDCLPPYSLQADLLTDSSAWLGWFYQGSADSFAVRYRPQGSLTWSPPQVTASLFFPLSGLSGCTPYQFQVQAYCGADSSGYLATGLFRTEGCCEPPPGRLVGSLTDTTAALRWRPVYGATAYRLQYRPAGDTLWLEVALPDTAGLLTGLRGCTGYQWRVATVCDSGGGEFSAVRSFTTQGCGACLDRPYCPSRGQDVSFEWIAGVQIGPLDRLSGPDSGYVQATDLVYQLVIDSTYDLRLTPGYGGFTFQEAWRVWIDLDQDGTFNDSTELRFEGGPQAGPLLGQLHLPAGIPTGPTRLRVSMKFPGFAGIDWPAACGAFDGGEVEDYCVTLSLGDTVLCPALTGLTAAYLPGSDSLRLGWAALPGAAAYDLRIRRVGLALWQEATLMDTALFFTNLDSCATYEWQVRARCGEFGGAYSPLQTFTSQGCGACLDRPYCPSAGESAVVWIQTTRLGEQAYATGPNGGYLALTGLPVNVRPGDSLTLTLVPGFATTPRPLGWYAWADWDQNGHFDAGEQLFAVENSTADTLRLRIPVPTGSLPGLTRLRVLLRGEAAPGDITSCGPQGAGEVEDYCLRVGATTALDSELTARLRLYPNPTTGLLTLDSPTPLQAVRLYDAQGRLVRRWEGRGQRTLRVDLHGLPAGVYGVVGGSGIGRVRLE